MTRGPEPHRPTTWGPEPNPNPNRRVGRGIMLKLILTRILDPNRPTTWDPDPNHNRPTGLELYEN